VGWEWALEHAAFPGPQLGTPIILGLDVIEHASGGDQLEFLLQVVWTDRGRLALDAAVNVACWCDTDHATHDIDALSSCCLSDLERCASNGSLDRVVAGCLAHTGGAS
jgi:hypothetical protein